MKTLLVLGTHFIDENVISEYRKMKNTPNVDAVLAIDNTNPKIEFENRVENKIFLCSKRLRYKKSIARAESLTAAKNPA